MADEDVGEAAGGAANSAKENPGKTSGRSRPGKLLRATLFFAGSAVFGGLAVAIWDRKVLTALRNKEGELASPASAPENDVE